MKRTDHLLAALSARCLVVAYRASGRTDRHRVHEPSKKFGSWESNLMTEWHSRYGGPGVVITWHVERRSMCIQTEELLLVRSRRDDRRPPLIAQQYDQKIR